MQTESIYYRRKWIMYKPSDYYDGSRVVESPILVTVWPDYHPSKESWDKTVKQFYTGKLIDWSDTWEEIDVNPDHDLRTKRKEITRERFAAISSYIENQLFGEHDED